MFELPELEEVDGDDSESNDDDINGDKEADDEAVAMDGEHEKADGDATAEAVIGNGGPSDDGKVSPATGAITKEITDDTDAATAMATTATTAGTCAEEKADGSDDVDGANVDEDKDMDVQAIKPSGKSQGLRGLAYCLKDGGYVITNHPIIARPVCFLRVLTKLGYNCLQMGGGGVH